MNRSTARRTQGAAGRLAVALALPALLALLSPLANRFPAGTTSLIWTLDLAAHWQWPSAIAWCAACLLGTVRDRRWLWGLPLAALPLLTASRALPQADGGTAALIVAAANVHVSNADPARLLAWLERRPANVVVVTELSPAFAAALEHDSARRYPHRALHPRSAPWGVGLLSDRTLHDVTTTSSAEGVLRLSATVLVDGRRVRIVGVHPAPPYSVQLQARRDAMVRAQSRRAPAMPTIVAGDFNATPWSRALLDPRAANLSRATGLAPTWPTHWKVVPGIPIDHVLASGHWRRGASQIGPALGSDHLPVRAVLHWNR